MNERERERERKRRAPEDDDVRSRSSSTERRKRHATESASLESGIGLGRSSSSSNGTGLGGGSHPPLPDAARGEEVPFPTESLDALESLITVFQKDAVVRQLADYARRIERLQEERNGLIERNSQLSDSLAAIGGWWTEIADELLVLSTRFEPQQPLETLLKQQDASRASFLAALLNVEQEEALEDQLNATHAQASQLVASFIHFLDHQVPPAPTDVNTLRTRYTEVRHQLVNVERHLAAARQRVSELSASLESRETELATVQRVVDRLQSRTWQVTFQQPTAPAGSDGPTGAASGAVGPGGAPASGAPAPASGDEGAAATAAAATSASLEEVQRKLLTLDDLSHLSESPLAKQLAELAEELAAVKRDRDALQLQAAATAAATGGSPPTSGDSGDSPAAVPSASTTQSLGVLRDELAVRTREYGQARHRAEELAAELAELRESHAAWLASHQDALATTTTMAEAETKRLSDEIARVRRQRDEVAQTRDSLTAERNAKLGNLDALRTQVEAQTARIAMLEGQVRRWRSTAAQAAGWTQVAALMEVDGNVVQQLEDRLRKLEGSSSAAAADAPSDNAVQIADLKTQLATAQAHIQALTEEMNSTADGYAQLDARISAHVAALRTRDEQVARLTADKAKLDSKILFLRKQCEQLKADADTGRRALEHVREVQRTAEEKDRAAVATVTALTREVHVAQDVATAAQNRAADLDIQLLHAQQAARDAEERVHAHTALLDTRTAEAEAAKAAAATANANVAQLQAVIAERDGVISDLRKALTAANAAAAGAGGAGNGAGFGSPAVGTGAKASDAELLAQYRQLVLCGTCRTRFKDTAITRCMHTFCRQCVNDRIETRQRKCPTCSEPFGQGDVRAIYM
ncbi:E3 ubiquitin-protein ligase bre1 [Blastocladiella emersonii ATCC 22665]|nr:E3 ubiquitin-protein ligase bre1 [Blastocladiella emersonii ATCC 22665]